MADPLSVTASIIAVLQLTSTVVKYLNDVKDAPKDQKNLTNELHSLHAILKAPERTVDGATSSNEAWSATIRTLGDPEGPLNVLKIALQQIADKFKGYTTATGIRKVANAIRWPFQTTEVEKLLRLIERQKSTLSLALEHDHIDLSRKICDNTDVTRNNVAGITKDLAQLDVKAYNENEVLSQLPCADSAPFNSFFRQHERQCLQETRVSLINEITTWGNTSDGPHMFCITGLAGTGKTTIAHTIAHHFAKQKRLGASFFFTRGQGDVGHAGKLFTTIAAQLAMSLPALRSYICEAIKEDYLVGSQSLSEQWRKLIVQPFSRMKSQRLPIIIIIDALDECEREDRNDDVTLVLRLFAEARNISTIQLRIFLTSRPDIRIQKHLRTLPKAAHQDCILHQISKYIVDHDIRIFLNYEFEQIRTKHELPDEWPKNEDLDSLVKDASGLFVYVATICRYISNFSPEKRLSIVLRKGSNNSNQIPNATRKLDDIYTQVMKSAMNEKYDEEEQEEVFERFKQTVGSIVILSNTLSSTALADLLSLPTREVEEILKQLQAVLDVPEAPDLPIRLIHPSFRDFLLNKKRCQDPQLQVDNREAHENMSESCLNLMSKTLKRNICSIRWPGTLVEDVQQDDVNQHISAAVQYACCYWVYHLQQSNSSLSDESAAYLFLQVHFLHWLEALSLIRKLSDGIHIITSLQSMIQFDSSPGFYVLVSDAKRFLLSNRLIIEKAPLQTYLSALVFCPEMSIVRKLFFKQTPDWITRLPEVEKEWSPCLQVLERQTHVVNAVAFSPDGKQLISGSDDKRVRLWDVATGMLQYILEGRSYAVNAVAFSPDGKQLVSGSYDKTVRLWDVARCMLQYILEGHSDGVMSVAFSPDGQQLVSGSGDKTVRLWDVATGMLQYILEGHSGFVNAVAFSPDGKQLISGSNDKTVRLWDVATGMLQYILEGHSDDVMSVAFSPDGQQLASAARDKTIRLWDITINTLKQKPKSYLSTVGRVTFLQDIEQIALRLPHQNIQLFDMATATLQQTLVEFHSDSEKFMVSPDGRQLALWLAYPRNEIQLWHKAVNVRQHNFDISDRHSVLMVFSPDGQQFAMASYSKDGSFIELCNTATGTFNRKSHLENVTSMVFSPDGRQLAAAFSSERGSSIELWNMAIGKLEQTLDTCSVYVASMAFSPNGRQLAYGTSHTETLGLLNLTTGLQECNIMTGPIKELSFVSSNTLRTDMGRIELDSSNPDKSKRSQWSSYYISYDSSWICWKGENILWLPAQYREDRRVFTDNVIFLGQTTSERLVTIEFVVDPSEGLGILP